MLDYWDGGGYWRIRPRQHRDQTRRKAKKLGQTLRGQRKRTFFFICSVSTVDIQEKLFL